ncbi:hypothetical protein CR194_09750 [Salipaludibacillus keqinensis]|uniref:DUF4064 domain-containing protein n=1 Tax=Salipaludibacillus keqinensis TaxID=2045207 RepID=A0A323TEI2_9BACI|nr:hypothetical protein [Salipaludibacillus keqinensis]PYZ93448.1 hypothetical protein CR194_09750 [Salipaludibacillus keqinensis]
MNQTMTFILGLIGGTVGFFYTLYAVYYGITDEFVFGESFVIGTSMAAMTISTIAIVGASFVKLRPKLSGWIMIITGLSLPLFISTFGFVPLVFLVPAGLKEISRKS